MSILSCGASKLERAAPGTVLSNDVSKLAFTIKEAGRAIGLSRSFLYGEIRRGTLIARKCGARTVILEAELRRFLHSLPELTGQERVA
jgi:hypothetical protein